ncbi:MULTISPECIES: phasin family protein [Aeromonas]|uniref:phasin family protein n=1 Tax=Aeromonas TaxID=642 RepID=UPI000463DF2A|nr:MULTISPECIES: phasin family protein [Aeromonas]MBL0460172.1 phasin family protein [Aeromonas dhakensis]QXC09711.1 phasin family protein [Aeromonas sp. FDAARGOS 1408]
MNMDVIKTFTEQVQGFAAPLTRYNQLLASNIEQLTRLQLASANAYAELGLNQLQAAGKVQDAQSLAALGTVQLETASQLSRQMLDDIQKLNALGQQFKDDLDALTADGIKKSTGKA